MWAGKPPILCVGGRIKENQMKYDTVGSFNSLFDPFICVLTFLGLFLNDFFCICVIVERRPLLFFLPNVPCLNLFSCFSRLEALGAPGLHQRSQMEKRSCC